MNLVRRIVHEALAYIGHVRQFKPNIRLLLAATILSSAGWGIFSVDFNLYILSLGFNPADLGVVLSMAPFAQILAAIPTGFVAELAGYRRVYLGIFIAAGLMQIMQASAASISLISLAAFVYGLGTAGSFVVRLPFLNANSDEGERMYVFSMDSLLTGGAAALGALLAGHLPGWLGVFTTSAVLQYRYTLYLGGALTLLSLLPLAMVRDQPPNTHKKISLKPYLWGIDRFTFSGALVEFFIGVTYGLIIPFINVYFIFHLGTTREFFSGVEALVWVPTSVALALAPLLARRLGNGGSITAGRLLLPVFPLLLGIAGVPWLGVLAYWGYRSIFSMSQSNWFSLAMTASAPRARVALSAWLEITFQIGMAMAALVGGRLLAQDDYTLPFVISAASAGLTVFLTRSLIMLPLQREPAGEAAS